MLPPRHWPEAAVTLFRTFGLRGAALRAIHEARRATNRFRTAPRRPVHESHPPEPHAFRVEPEALRAATDRDAALDRAERVVAGEHQAFRCDWRPLPEDSASWLLHPRTGRRARGGPEWWKILHLDRHVGDVKEIWEPARFGWSYDLVRAWLITGDDRYAAAFHRHLGAWVESSPPFRGPHWSCGQETAIRASALLYAEANLADAPSSTSAAMARVRDVLAASGERIADAMGYAISQRNNHALSEATGLVVLGVRFRGRHPAAGCWLARGHRWLERLVPEQIARDGWYTQHSFTYQRLALDQLVLAERALRSVGRSLSDTARDRIRAACDLLLEVLDAETGIVPNHGPNDGAFVHPVTLARYRDFRPVVTAACATWDHPLPADVPPDPETLAWLGAPPLRNAPPRAEGLRTGESGWAVVRTGDTVVFLRAGRYRSRPGHLDPLHLDVRMAGAELIVDPGTFSYNAPGPWSRGLAAARAHNGPLADGTEPGVRGPRFLWYQWPTAELVHAEWEKDRAALVAELPGRVRRSVEVRPGHVRVRDELLDPGASSLSVVWTLHPDADPGLVSTPARARAGKAEADGVRGWFSPCYGDRLPTTFLELEGGRAAPVLTEIRRPGAGSAVAAGPAREAK